MSDERPAEEKSFGELFSAAMRGSALGKLAPGELPSGRDLLGAVGGARGLVESILPGLAFLVAYAVTSILLGAQQSIVLVWSVGAPLVLSVVFVAVRLLARQPVRPALTGVLVAAITAALALITGRTQDSFIPGMVINAISFTVLLVSILARWPLVGLIVGALTNDLTGWRADVAKRRVLTVATWMWVGLFVLRLAVEVPLFLTAQTAWLAAAKLLLGVPVYALLLWVTWLFVSSAFARPQPDPGAEGVA